MIKYVAAFSVAMALAFVGCDGHENHDHHHEDGKAGAHKTQDPVCGMDVDPAAAKFKSTDSGKEFAFCSAACKEKFDKSPKSYLMGYCACRTTMPNCDCGHCKGLAANSTPTKPCPCDEEEKEHKHNH